MASVFDVANFFIEVSPAFDDNMTQMKLYKMLYYAQGWSLVKLGRPLFDDEIQAWDYGPVPQRARGKYARYSRDTITQVDPGYNPDVFTDEEESLLFDVARKYGKYTAPALSTMTHVPGGPWDRAYRKGNNSVIDLQEMKEYFSRREGELQSFDELIAKKEILPGRDKDGCMVLPEDMFN